MTTDALLTPLKEGIAKLRDAELQALAEVPPGLRSKAQALNLREHGGWESLAVSVPEIHRLVLISELVTFAEFALDDLQNEGRPQPPPDLTLRKKR